MTPPFRFDRLIKLMTGLGIIGFLAGAVLALIEPPAERTAGLELCALSLLCLLIGLWQGNQTNRVARVQTSGRWYILAVIWLVVGLLLVGLAGLFFNRLKTIPLFVCLALAVGLLVLALLAYRRGRALSEELRIARVHGFESYSSYYSNRHKAGWTDERIATELGKSRRWVESARRRSQAYHRYKELYGAAQDRAAERP